MAPLELGSAQPTQICISPETILSHGYLLSIVLDGQEKAVIPEKKYVCVCMYIRLCKD